MSMGMMMVPIIFLIILFMLFIFFLIITSRQEKTLKTIDKEGKIKEDKPVVKENLMHLLPRKKKHIKKKMFLDLWNLIE